MDEAFGERNMASYGRPDSPSGLKCKSSQANPSKIGLNSEEAIGKTVSK